MRQNEFLNVVVEEIFFGSIKTEEQFLKAIEGEYSYRKNKTLADVMKALDKGKKLGCGKFEREVSCSVLYLKEDVLKKKRVGGRKGDGKFAR